MSETNDSKPAGDGPADNTREKPKTERYVVDLRPRPLVVEGKYFDGGYVAAMGPIAWTVLTYLKYQADKEGLVIAFADLDTRLGLTKRDVDVAIDTLVHLQHIEPKGVGAWQLFAAEGSGLDWRRS